MNCEDCVYADIADWEQNEKTGKAKAVYWCERHKKMCNDIQECQFEDNGFFDEIMDESEDGEVYEKIKEIIAKVKEQEE